MSQHVPKATVQGFIAKITQKIHVLLANKHLKKPAIEKNAEPCSWPCGKIMNAERRY